MSVDLRGTAARRPATGLDRGARQVILGVVGDAIGDGDCRLVVAAFFRDRFGSFQDYYEAVEQVHGRAIAGSLNDMVQDAMHAAEFSSTWPRPNEEIAGQEALLLAMPEADFRLAVEATLWRGGVDRLPRRGAARITRAQAAQRITEICRHRGAPWAFEVEAGFKWIGDEAVEAHLVAPAAAAINDRRFSGGVRSEFEAARAALRDGTAVADKRAIHDAACAVESAMKVVLDHRRVEYDPKDAAQSLFNRLKADGIVPSWMERIVLGAAMPRNKTAGHGAGRQAHEPGHEEALAVVASAAGAIAYLHTVLP